MNNFRTLSLNYNTIEPGTFSLLQQIACASSGVSRIMIRLSSAANSPLYMVDERNEEFTKARMRSIQHLNQWVHAIGRLGRVTTGYTDEEWFWEAPPFQFLDIEHPGRKKVSKATSGNMTLENRISGRRSILIE